MNPSLDNCPTCGRRITDVDPDGCETGFGQRFCLAHLTYDADPELFDAYQRHLAGEQVTA